MLKCLKISGPDAFKLLQGQVTLDLRELSQDQGQWCAHCNPQGRIISLFRIHLSGNDYVLEMPDCLIPITQNSLKKYAVFYKVAIEQIEPSSDMIERFSSVDCIQSKIPVIYAETSAVFLPHELTLPALGAVSFNKGCYTGQEIIARMEYRSQRRHTLLSGRVENTIPLKRGQDIYDTSHIVGKIVDYTPINNAQAWVLLSTLNTSDPLFLDAQLTVSIQPI